MLEVEFDYAQQITVIQAKIEDKFKEVINKYYQKTSINPDNVCFLTNGKQIKLEETVESQMNGINKQNKNMKVLVHTIEDETPDSDIIIKSKDIICPICRESCRIKVENYKIKLFGCINQHTTNNIKIKDFPNTQKINISKLVCNKCKIKNRGDSYKNEFYKCLTCNQNLCLLCKTSHETDHHIIKYEQKNYICYEHNEHLIKYCKDCNRNICFLCDEEHNKHNTIFLGDLIPDIKQSKNKLLDLKTEIDIFNNKIKKVIKQLNELIDTMNIYYEIFNNILNGYEKKNRNYQILKNINEINNDNKIIEALHEINKASNIMDFFNNIFGLYNNINSDNKDIQQIKIESIIKTNQNDEKIKSNNDNNDISEQNTNKMTVIYNINKNLNKIRIFDINFVKNNKNKCYLLINGQKNELSEYYIINKEQKAKNTLEIKLIETKKITNMSYMFKNCNVLLFLPDFSSWNTENVTDMSYMFYNCSSIISLPNISKWETKNVTSMSGMFKNCSSLLSLPDISKWDTSKVINMYSMFSDCGSLKSLPDISKWDIKNVTNINSMFSNCSSLKSLPDISKWNTKNVKDINSIFYNCRSLISLPDISKWNIKNVTDIKYIFDNCNSLKTIPEISNWDIKSVPNIRFSFVGNNSIFDCE